MSNQKEKIFADGFRFERKENAPTFVVGRMSIKVDEAIAFLKSYEKAGWVNLNILNGRSGNPYVELDMYEPTKKGGATTTQEPAAKPAPKPSAEEEAEDLPF